MAKPIGNQVANMKLENKTSRRVKEKFESKPATPVDKDAIKAAKAKKIQIKVRKK